MLRSVVAADEVAPLGSGRQRPLEEDVIQIGTGVDDGHLDALARCAERKLRCIQADLRKGAVFSGIIWYWPPAHMGELPPAEKDAMLAVAWAPSTAPASDGE